MGPRNAPGGDVTVAPGAGGCTPRAGIVVVADRAHPHETALLTGAGFEVIDVHLAEPVDGGESTSDFAVLAALTRARDQLDPSRPRFVLGIGAGGVHARSFACTARGLAGAVSFQGALVYPTLTAQRPAQPMDLLPGLGCPLLCHLAELDSELTRAQVARFEERLQACRPTALVYHYAGVAPSAFVTLEPATTTDCHAHALSWARTRAFLAHLVAAAG